MKQAQVLTEKDTKRVLAQVARLRAPTMESGNLGHFREKLVGQRSALKGRYSHHGRFMPTSVTT